MFPVSAPAEASARRIVVPVPEPTVNPIAANASRLREQAGKAAPAARTTDIPAVRETRFVMGLDFGTTYTGISTIISL